MGVSAPNPCVIQESTVITKSIDPLMISRARKKFRCQKVKSDSRCGKKMGFSIVGSSGLCKD